MNIYDLAEALRARTEKYVKRNPDKFTPADRDVIKRRCRDVSDEDMIDSYATCSGCGAKWLDGPALDAMIAHADTAECFLQLIPHSCHDN